MPVLWNLLMSPITDAHFSVHITVNHSEISRDFFEGIKRKNMILPFQWVSSAPRMLTKIVNPIYSMVYN